MKKSFSLTHISAITKICRLQIVGPLRSVTAGSAVQKKNWIFLQFLVPQIELKHVILMEQRQMNCTLSYAASLQEAVRLEPRDSLMTDFDNCRPLMTNFDNC